MRNQVERLVRSLAAFQDRRGLSKIRLVLDKAGNYMVLSKAEEVSCSSQEVPEMILEFPLLPWIRTKP